MMTVDNFKPARSWKPTVRKAVTTQNLEATQCYVGTGLVALCSEKTTRTSLAIPAVKGSYAKGHHPLVVKSI